MLNLPLTFLSNGPYFLTKDKPSSIRHKKLLQFRRKIVIAFTIRVTMINVVIVEHSCCPDISPVVDLNFGKDKMAFINKSLWFY